MRLRRALVAALLITLVLPLSGQEERQPFFSISSDRTYLPGERPRIQVWAQNVDALEFRVYRIIDPLAFFEKLEDSHQFGGRAPVLPHKESWLEQFHDWKHEWRIRVRDLIRAQFSAESRGRIRDWWVERRREKVVSKGPTQYAQVPVLNPQQLISEWRQNVRAGSRWESLTVPVDVPGRGLYLVEATNGELRAYTIVSVTEIGIISKAAPGRVVAFVQNRRSGAPLANCLLIVRSNKREAARVSTDAQGLAETTLSESKPEDTLVLARQGDDFAVASLSAWNLSNDPEHYATGYIYTDRPVYRPGHTVFFRAILRAQAGAEYRLPAQREAGVEIHDPENKTIFQKTLPISSFGTLQGQFLLPETAALGYYSIWVRSGGPYGQTGGFHVEEYKKPEYDVRVTPEVRRVLQGEPIKATIEARYYFGEPVARAKVAYVVHQSPAWNALFPDEEEESAGEGGEAEGAEGEGAGDSGGEQVGETTGQLDADGKLTITIPTRVAAHKGDVNYRIEARVTDQSNREISGHTFALATYGSFQVGIQPEQYVYAPGDTARFNVLARDYDSRGVSTAVHVEFYASNWRQPQEKAKPILVADSRTDSTGNAKVEFHLRQAGSFYARVSAKTPEAREVEGRNYIWVSGESEGWYGRGAAQIQIVADKKSYSPGEIAKMLIVTGIAETNLLVTTEGQELYSRRVVRATGPSVIVEVPVRAEHAPNFYVNVAFLKDNQLHQGSKMLRVPPLEHQLSVDLLPSKSQYQPGEPVVYTVSARDSTGKAVAAEFSLGVVDEAIYAIRPESVQDIVKFFYGRTYNRVSTDTSLSYYFHGSAGKRSMHLTRDTGARPRTSLAQLKPERLIEPRVRKAFPDTARWVANLMTDANGRAQVKFDFPDALTTWRATARGVTRDTRVGSAVQRTVVRKNLILRLATPRFFTEGDEVTLSALVHNYLTTEKTVRVSLDVEGLDVLAGARSEVVVPSRGDAHVEWRVRAKPGGEARLLSKALTNEESDAVELTLPIIPYGVKLSAARAGSLTEPTGQAEPELVFPEQVEPSSRLLEVSVSPSLAGTIFGALEYLTSYPYGCTEQTMSSFLPNILVAQALKDLGVKSNVDQPALQKKIRGGMERLYDFQHPDGGWGWWKTDDTAPFMTAYVLFGFSQAKSAGYPVREESLVRARQWLRGAFEREKRALPDLRAYMAYSLAMSGEKDRAALDSVWEQRAELTPYGRALLGLALDAAGDARAMELAAQLEAQAKSDELEAHWESNRDTLMDFYGDASPEATAYAMKLLARLRPQSPLLPRAAVYLVNHRSGGYYWYSTKQTAMVIYGLMDYLKGSGELKPNFTAAVTLNGKQILSNRFGESDAFAPAPSTVRIAAKDLAAGSNKVRITKSGAGRLYWTARVEYYSTEEKLQRTGTVSLNLLREYFKLAPSREGEKIVYRLEPLQGAVAPGDVVAVRLTVSGSDNWKYLMIEDPIPAGTEFIERDDLYEIKEKPAWWGFWFTRREFHDNRAVFFQTYMQRGQMQYLYLLKVVNPGRFRVSPARVQPMYQPQYLSTTEARTVEVK